MFCKGTSLPDKQTWHNVERLHVPLEARGHGTFQSGHASVLLLCRIKVQSLDSSTDIQALAWHIVSKCELINMSRVPEVEQLLSYLQNRNKGKGHTVT